MDKNSTNSTYMASYQIQNVQNYIKELEISEGQLSSCIRGIYETKQKDEFMKRLDDKIKQYDNEIEKLCSKNYQTFVDSFYKLIGFREDTSNLKNSLIENNQQIQKIGKKLVNKVDDLVKETVKQNNLLMTIATLQKFLPVFDVYRQLNDYMQQKNYYPALKLLAELENNYLPIIKQYRFSISIQNAIPKFKKEIETESLNDLKAFLEKLLCESELIGKIASAQMAKKNKIDRQYYLLESETTQTNNDGGGDGSKSIDDFPQKFPFDVVDFSPLYRNLHINQILGVKSSFSDYYRKQRIKQLKLVLKIAGGPDSVNNDDLASLSNQNLELDTLDGVKRYFHAVTGFFVIEDQILSSTEGLIDERYLDELANSAIPKLSSVIRESMTLSKDKDAEQMLKVKIIVVLFCNTIAEVQFPTTQLSDLLKEIRDIYYEMLLDNWNNKIRDIINADNYTYIEVENEKEYKELKKRFPIEIDTFDSNKKTYPKSMGYSPCVPKIFKEIKQFINNAAKFADGLNSSQTELDDMVRKPTNKLITDKLKENISASITYNEPITIPKLVQVVINTLYLEKSIELLENHLLGVINATSKQSGKLQGISVFKDLRSEAESRIYDFLNTKIEDLLDFSGFNWTMSEASGKASGYMTELIAYLTDNLNSFNNLPSKLAQTACISSCKHVAQQFMFSMLKPDVKAITFAAYEQLNLDLMQCESFANQICIDGLDNDTILLCFSDLRQILDLILFKEWSSYTADYGKAHRYDRVQASTALALLEKLKEGYKRGKGVKEFFGFGVKQSEKDDKALVEAAINSLRTIIHQSGTH